MEIISSIISNKYSNIIVSIVVIIICYACYKTINYLLKKGEKNGFKIFTSTKVRHILE